MCRLSAAQAAWIGEALSGERSTRPQAQGFQVLDQCICANFHWMSLASGYWMSVWTVVCNPGRTGQSHGRGGAKLDSAHSWMPLCDLEQAPGLGWTFTSSQ